MACGRSRRARHLQVNRTRQKPTEGRTRNPGQPGFFALKMTQSRSIVAPAVALALLGAGASGVAAAEIEITKGDCKTGVQLVAHDAPLREVLERLSKTLSFHLQLEGEAETPVNVSTSAPAPALIA